jgi:heptosyltransferase-2/heptosyltransferase-3
VSRPRITRLLGADYLAPTWYPRAALYGLAALDRARRVTSAPRPPRTCPPLARATIAVVKPDHLGDLLQATPLLRALRTQLPDARLVLVHGRWTRALAQWLVTHDYVHLLVEHDMAWLHAPGTPWRERLAADSATRDRAAAALRAAETDVLLDVRCTSPTALPLARALPRAWRAGFGLRGGAWEYDATIPYDDRVPLPQNWLHALPVLGLAPVTYAGPVLPAPPPRADDAPIVVQATSRTTAKEPPADAWARILPVLAAIAPVQLVGAAGERARLDALVAHGPAGRIVNRAGETDLPALVDLVGGARAVVGTDSVATTLALGHRVPAAVLLRDGMGSASLPDAAPTLRLVRDDAAPEAIVSALRDAGLRP